MISGKTKVFGLFGYPVEHTFSPMMHNAAFERLKMDACYLPFEVHPDRLKDAVAGVSALNIRGVNVTVPHKERAIPFLDDLSQEARLIGAVNTIEVKEGRLVGHNTDARGFIRSLEEEAGFDVKGRNILILGAGGAGRAVAFGLALAGADHLGVHDVDAEKCRLLAKDIMEKTGVHAAAIEPGDIPKFAPEADCVINATPLGLKPSDPLPLDDVYIKKGMLVCDLVYNPPQTSLLSAAKARGARILSGLGMLLYQGVAAFEIWTGREAPVPVMKKALEDQIAGRR